MSQADDPPAGGPLKRHETLQPLSREHMAELVFVRTLRRACEGHPGPEIVELLRTSWETELRAHFLDEEWIVGPLVSPTMRERLVAEHHELERRILRVLGHNTADSGWLREEIATIAGLLEAHIRWEERSLFERAQQYGSPALDAARPEADRIHRERPGSRPHGWAGEKDTQAAEDATWTPPGSGTGELAGVHPGFPISITSVEAAAGFIPVRILNPLASEPGASTELLAAVCPIDLDNRLLKVRTDEGHIGYVHRRRGSTAQGWRSITEPIGDVFTALMAATHGRSPG